MNIYAFIDDYIFCHCVLKHYLLPELINYIMIFYIDHSEEILVTGDYHTFHYKSNILTGFGWNEYSQLCLEKIIKKTRKSEKIVPNLNMIVCGSLFSVFVSNNNIYGVGNNYSGQIGQFININVNIPEKIKINGKIKTIACGAYHTLILTSDKIVYGLGDNSYGQLYQDIKADRIFAGGFQSFIIYNHIVYGFGANLYGQLGLGHNQDVHSPQKINLSHVIHISCGLGHSMFVCKNGDMYASGNNNHGQLGLGNYDNYNIPQKVLSNVLLVSCGDYFTIVLTKTGLYGFGSNKYGQLGINDYDCCSPSKINISNVINISCGKNFVIINTKNGMYGLGADGKKQLGYCKKLIKI